MPCPAVLGYDKRGGRSENEPPRRIYSRPGVNCGRGALDYGCAMLIDRNDLPNDLFGIPELDLSGGLCAEVKGAPEACCQLLFMASCFHFDNPELALVINDGRSLTGLPQRPTMPFYCSASTSLHCRSGRFLILSPTGM